MAKQGLTPRCQALLLLSLASQTTEIPLELGGSLGGIISQTASACSGPQSSVGALRLPAIAITLVDPVALGLSEPLLEIRPARLSRLNDQVLVGAVEIRVVRYDRAIETRALVDSSR